ncbi:MAG: DUF92 domain-containing protein [Candidatus Micrarchaeia archaeon]
MTFLTLDNAGVIGGLLLAFALFVLGLQFGVMFVGSMILFLVASAIVTKAGEKRKKKIGTYEKARGIRNVIANGLGPLMMALLFYIFATKGMELLESLSVIGFLGSIAAITSDKFASEIGVLGNEPVELLTLKKVKRGTSGAVSTLGLVASFFGSFIISLVALPYAGILFYPYNYALQAVAAIAIGGFIGSIIDSALGYYEERGIGNKFSTNFICSISGALASILLFMLL